LAEGAVCGFASGSTGRGWELSGGKRSTATIQPAAPSAPSMKPRIARRLIAGGKVRRCGTVASPMTRAAEVLRLSCSSVSRERLRKDW
jgi:hypothetical protein